VSEYNARTGQTTPQPSTDTFSINFIYDANATERLERRWDNADNLMSMAGYIALHPAITFLEITRGNQTWTTNMGYVNSYGQTVYVTDLELSNIIETSWDNYLITAYADPTAAVSGNDSEFFGVDFHGFRLFSGITEDTSPAQEEHDITNLPTGDDFNQMGISRYLNGGDIILTGTPTSFNVAPIP